MDSGWNSHPDYLPERVSYLGAQLNELFEKSGELLGIKVDQAAWDKAMSVSRELFGAIGQLDELLKADPMPISQAAIGLALWLASGSTGRAMIEGPKAIEILIQEVKKRISDGIGIVEKGAPRVMTLLTHFSDPSIVRMMEDAGLAVCATVFSTPPPKAKSKTIYGTLGETIAEREMRLGIYHSNYGLIKRCAYSIAEMGVVGLIWNYLFSCRPLAQTSHILKKWVEENTGVPVLSLETDAYDSRDYSAATLATRVQTFAEMLRARKATGQ